MLDVAVSGGREIDQFFLLVADQITILVLTEPKGSRFHDQYAAIYERDAANVDHVVHEGGGLVHRAIAVGIFENHDPAFSLVLVRSVEVDHVGAKFTDPHPALVVPVHEDGILDHGLVSHELDLEAGGDFELGEGFLGREDGHRVGRPFFPVERSKQVFGLFLTVSLLGMGKRSEKQKTDKGYEMGIHRVTLVIIIKEPSQEKAWAKDFSMPQRAGIEDDRLDLLLVEHPLVNGHAGLSVDGPFGNFCGGIENGFT